MLIQNPHHHTKFPLYKSKTISKVNPQPHNPYLQHKNHQTHHYNNKFQQYLPTLTLNNIPNINNPNPEASKRSVHKLHITNPSNKPTKTQPSPNHHINGSIYSLPISSHKNKKIKQKTKYNKVWHPLINQNKKQHKTNNSNNASKITLYNQSPSQHLTYTNADSVFTHYHEIYSEIPHRSSTYSNHHNSKTQTFQENIIRNRLQIKSSLQLQQQKPLNCTLLAKNHSRFRTQIHQQQDHTESIGPSRLDTQSDFKPYHKSKKLLSTTNKHPDFSKVKYKTKKSNLYVPSFTHQKIAPSLIQNLLQKVQFQSEIKKYQTQTFGKQILFRIPEENHKLEKQIEKIQVYFSKNKKGWFSQQLQKVLKASTKNLKFNNQAEGESPQDHTKQRSRSQKIGKIVRQLSKSKLDKKKQTQSCYTDQRFEQQIKESDLNQGETVRVHDNSYRKQIVQLDSSTEQNQTQMNLLSAHMLSKKASEECLSIAKDKYNQQTKSLMRSQGNKNHQSKIQINDRPKSTKSTESLKSRNSSNIKKRKSQERDECIIF